MKRRFCGLLVVLFFFFTFTAHAQGCHIVLGHADLSSDEVTANLVRLVLERLGCSVSVQKGGDAQLYSQVGRGEIDLLVAAAWLPHAHAAYAEQSKDGAIKITSLYDDARLFWAVPDYIPEANVNSVADLRKPGVAARMQKEIRGPGVESALMIGSGRIFAEYGLEQSGYRLIPARPADWIADFNDNIAAQRWFVMPLWRPHYLNKQHRLRILEEPKQLLGGADHAWLVAHEDFRAKVGKRTWRALQRMSLSAQAVTEMDYLVNVKKLSPRDAARGWIGAHPDTVTYWLEPEPED